MYGRIPGLKLSPTDSGLFNAATRLYKTYLKLGKMNAAVKTREDRIEYNRFKAEVSPSFNEARDFALKDEYTQRMLSARLNEIFAYYGTKKIREGHWITAHLNFFRFFRDSEKNNLVNQTLIILSQTKQYEPIFKIWTRI